ncbi:MAG: type III secretion system export apparatus subunit SctR [Kiloniellales bacterium]|nr:type III secretion system export apparatus subunit SctR [Kiloniellales bacterium]
MLDQLPSIGPTLIALGAAGLIPILVVTTTAFAKVTIVLFLLRNALGVQQAPTGLVLNVVALMLTFFISGPMWFEIIESIQDADIDFSTIDSVKEAYPLIEEPLRAQLSSFATDREKAFFISAAKELWPARLHGYATPDSLFIIVPAFVISEITRAFEIGFMLFLPFVVIDMIVSNVLLAMGAMMVPPMLISLPAKLFLFVAADGWARVLHGLLVSYIP